MRTWGLVLALVLAGCAASPATSSDADELDPKDVDTGPDDGAISGIVVTEAIVPVANATVRIITTDLETTTDAEGQFVFQDLQPGAYFLNVTAPGHLPVQTSTQVAAGEVSKVRILVAPDPQPAPWHETLSFNGFIKASAGIATFAVQVFVGDSSLCECQFDFEPGPNVHTFVYEAHWEPNIENHVGENELYWELTSRDPQVIQSTYDPSPILHHIPRDVYPAESTTWMARLTGDLDWPSVDQPYEMFVTNFYEAAPPEGWSIVAGSA